MRSFLSITSFILSQFLFIPAFSAMSSPLSLNLKGTYQEKAPDTKRVVWKYFKNLTFADDSYTLLDIFYCPPGVACPKTLLPILPTSGHFSLNTDSSQELAGTNIQLILDPSASNQEQTSFNKPKRVFTIQVEDHQQLDEIRLTEVGHNGKEFEENADFDFHLSKLSALRYLLI